MRGQKLWDTYRYLHTYIHTVLYEGWEWIATVPSVYRTWYWRIKCPASGAPRHWTDLIVLLCDPRGITENIEKLLSCKLGESFGAHSQPLLSGGQAATKWDLYQIIHWICAEFNIYFLFLQICLQICAEFNIYFLFLQICWQILHKSCE
jgi:hypothetical protein